MDNFYIYMYYFIDSGEVFYIGKGKGNRYLDTVHSRNKYFKNIINKYGDNVGVKFYIENISEEEAFNLERKLIKEYWKKGECKANFHEGGRGGNTGNYDNPERSRKLSESAKKRVGNLNPMYGKTHSDETKKYLREINLGRTLSEEHKQKLIEANRGRKKTQSELEKISKINKGKKMSNEQRNKMMISLSEYRYDIFLDNEWITSILGHTDLYRFCKKEFGISRTIVDKICQQDWFPKFEKHKHLKELKIVKVWRKCID